MIQTVCKTKKKLTSAEWKRILFYVGIILLPLAQFLIFNIIVNANSVIMAFQHWTYSPNEEIWVASFAGFDNFKECFTDIFVNGKYNVEFRNSLIVWATSLLVTTPLALLFSFYIAKKLRGSKLFRTILFIPTMICSVVLCLIFKTLYEAIFPSIYHRIFYPDISYSEFQSLDIFNNFLFNTGGPKIFFAILCYHLFLSFGTNVLLYTGAMTAVNTNIIEASKIDGCGDWNEFIHVILPSIFPTIVSFIVVGLGEIFIQQLHLYDLFASTAPDGTYTIGYTMYAQTIHYVTKGTASTMYTMFPYLSCLGLIFTIFITPIALGVKKLLERIGPSPK